MRHPKEMYKGQAEPWKCRKEADPSHRRRRSEKKSERKSMIGYRRKRERERERESRKRSNAESTTPATGARKGEKKKEERKGGESRTSKGEKTTFRTNFKWDMPMGD